MLEEIKKGLMASFGTIFITKEKIEEATKKMVEQAKISKEDAQKLADELAFFINALDARGRAFMLGERDLLGALPGQGEGARAAARAGMIASAPERPAAVSASITAVPILMIPTGPEMCSIPTVWLNTMRFIVK